MGRKVNTLYILGNGFDISHRYSPWNSFGKGEAFKTSYKDFRDFCKDEYPILYHILSSVLDDKWNTFEDGLGQIPFETLFLQSGHSDFRDYVDQFHEELKDAFEKWINQVNIKKGRCWRIKRRKRAFFTFNYTNTLEACYSIDSCDILHIHGVCCDPNDVHLRTIIGHALTDEEIKEKASSVNINYRADYIDLLTWLQKDTQSNLYDVQNQLFFKRIKTAQKVYFYGFSFGIVDYPYIDYICKQLSQNTKYIIAFHTDSDLESINRYLDHYPFIKDNVQLVKDSKCKTLIFKVLSLFNNLLLSLKKEN